MSVNDVRREITFCRRVGLPIAGIVENMSGFTCPHCKECTYIFAREGGKSLAEKTECVFLGTIPIDPALTNCFEHGKNFLNELKNSAIMENLDSIVNNLIKN